jgi:hypothetical protein
MADKWEPLHEGSPSACGSYEARTNKAKQKPNIHTMHHGSYVTASTGCDMFARDFVSAETGHSLINTTNNLQRLRDSMGAANGIATLDATGCLPAHQLPSSFRALLDAVEALTRRIDALTEDLYHPDHGPLAHVARQRFRERQQELEQERPGPSSTSKRNRP